MKTKTKTGGNLNVFNDSLKDYLNNQKRRKSVLPVKQDPSRKEGTEIDVNHEDRKRDKTEVRDLTNLKKSKFKDKGRKPEKREQEEIIDKQRHYLFGNKDMDFLIAKLVVAKEFKLAMAVFKMR